MYLGAIGQGVITRLTYDCPSFCHLSGGPVFNELFMREMIEATKEDNEGIKEEIL